MLLKLIYFAKKIGEHLVLTKLRKYFYCYLMYNKTLIVQSAVENRRRKLRMQINFHEVKNQKKDIIAEILISVEAAVFHCLSHKIQPFGFCFEKGEWNFSR